MNERGQALVEAVVALPTCLVCALALVDCGVVVRDRIAVTQAATRAAEVELVGGDPLAAARAGLPGPLRSSIEVEAVSGRVVVTARSGSRIAALAGTRVVHRSSVEVPR